MTNNPNANLIEAMKEKLPLKGQLADMLMDTLYIGKIGIQILTISVEDWGERQDIDLDMDL